MVGRKRKVWVGPWGRKWVELNGGPGGKQRERKREREPRERETALA